MADPSGDALPPAPARHSAAARRRRLVPLLVGGVVVLVAAVALVWALTGGRAENEAERTARRFVGALLQGDCREVLAAVSAATNRHFDDVTDLFTSAADPDGFDLRREACPAIRQTGRRQAEVTKAETLLDTDERALVHVTTTAGTGRMSVLRVVDVYVVRDPDGWKVDLTLDVINSNFVLSQVFRRPAQPATAG